MYVVSMCDYVQDIPENMRAAENPDSDTAVLLHGCSYKEVQSQRPQIRNIVG